ncbi:hypothetical protein FAGKG844_10320 [Frankia sp. AgKG'84/4]
MSGDACACAEGFPGAPAGGWDLSSADSSQGRMRAGTPVFAGRPASWRGDLPGILRRSSTARGRSSQRWRRVRPEIGGARG